MEAQALHDLTAPYALDALGAEERAEYEAHLARCERCRADLASLSEAASSLAFGVEAPVPPQQLRDRIIERARAERPNVVPLRARRPRPATAVLAAAAIAAVIVLSLWISSLSNKVDRLQAQRAREERVAAIVSSSGARPIEIGGGRGTLVVTRAGEAALVLRRLRPLSSGTYEAWVAQGSAPRPAGTFQSDGSVTAIPLELSVPSGATVMVTREKHRVQQPTSAPFISVTT